MKSIWSKGILRRRKGRRQLLETPTFLPSSGRSFTGLLRELLRYNICQQLRVSQTTGQCCPGPPQRSVNKLNIVALSADLEPNRGARRPL